MLLRAQASANRGFLDVATREGKFEGLAGPDKAEETGGGGIGQWPGRVAVEPGLGADGGGQLNQVVVIGMNTGPCGELL